METFKQQCLDLRKAGHTLTEIVKITGRPKTSIYFHINSIPLSEEKIRLIRIASGIRARNIALSRRGKSERQFRRFNKWSSNTVSLLGHLIFDGSIIRTSCIYNNRNISLINKVENSMKNIYDHKPKRWINNETGVSRISYHNVALGTYLQEKSKELLNNICSLSIGLKKEFLKAFFNDEGCIDFRPKRNLRQIRGYQKDKSILFLIQKLLCDFGIESRVVNPNEIVISGKENLQKFQKRIGFSPGVYINGNRSNSIWKKSLEKKVLLNEAIKSFKLPSH